MEKQRTNSMTERNIRFCFGRTVVLMDKLKAVQDVLRECGDSIPDERKGILEKYGLESESGMEMLQRYSPISGEQPTPLDIVALAVESPKSYLAFTKEIASIKDTFGLQWDDNQLPRNSACLPTANGYLIENMILHNESYTSGIGSLWSDIDRDSIDLYSMYHDGYYMDENEKAIFSFLSQRNEAGKLKVNGLDKIPLAAVPYIIKDTEETLQAVQDTMIERIADSTTEISPEEDQAIQSKLEKVGWAIQGLKYVSHAMGEGLDEYCRQWDMDHARLMEDEPYRSKFWMPQSPYLKFLSEQVREHSKYNRETVAKECARHCLQEKFGMTQFPDKVVDQLALDLLASPEVTLEPGKTTWEFSNDELQSGHCAYEVVEKSVASWSSYAWGKEAVAEMLMQNGHIGDREKIPEFTLQAAMAAHSRGKLDKFMAEIAWDAEEEAKYILELKAEHYGYKRDAGYPEKAFRELTQELRDISDHSNGWDQAVKKTAAEYLKQWNEQSWAREFSKDLLQEHFTNLEEIPVEDFEAMTKGLAEKLMESTEFANPKDPNEIVKEYLTEYMEDMEREDVEEVQEEEPVAAKKTEDHNSTDEEDWDAR